MSEKPTMLEALMATLERAGAYNSHDQVAPAAILWPDPGPEPEGEPEWQALLPRLRELLPHLLTYGEYDPATRTGPAIWLRCMVERTLPEAAWPAQTIPIIYLPGVSRQQLRPADETPWLLRPLLELQYRGVVWTQYNGRDWTIAAFLQTERGGLGLEVAGDQATRAALRRALLRLAEEPAAHLRGKRIDAAFLDQLLQPDLDREVLRWMEAPQPRREEWGEAHWTAFCSRCRQELGFDPTAEGELGAAERLGLRQGRWAQVWERFEEAAGNYPQLPELLRRARPQSSDLFFERSSWPQDNEAAEQTLREGLLGLASAPPGEARAALGKLEAEHGERRRWVWSRLGHAPLAQALEALARLAQMTTSALGGATPQDMAQSYAQEGWRADAAALEALAAVSAPADQSAVQSAVRAVYLPWLERAAEQFQQAVKQASLGSAPAEPQPAQAGVCLLFADGLRMDVGRKMQAHLEQRGFTLAAGWIFAALPTVTATAKPAVSPVADLVGQQGGVDFVPLLKSGKGLTAPEFRKLLAERGYQVLSGEDTGDPRQAAWAEYGRLDRHGHDEGTRLAHRVEEQVQGLADRIEALLQAGWREVRVVTDHGWLLMPGGLPKTDLPAYLVESRWGRCAALKDTSHVELPTVAWHWNPQMQVAMAPGVSCFTKGMEFAHGGLSVQECVVPTLTVTMSKTLPMVTLQPPRWVGLRCRVSVPGGAGLRVDLRTRAADPESSLLSAPGTVAADGTASVVVEDDTREGEAVTLVVLDGSDSVLGREPTTVGG